MLSSPQAGGWCLGATLHSSSNLFTAIICHASLALMVAAFNEKKEAITAVLSCLQLLLPRTVLGELKERGEEGILRQKQLRRFQWILQRFLEAD